MKRLRDNLLIFPSSVEGGATFIQDQESLALHKLTKQDQSLLEAIRSGGTPDEMLEIANHRSAIPVTSQALETFLGRLDRLGLLVDAPDAARPVGEGANEQQDSAPQPEMPTPGGAGLAATPPARIRIARDASEEKPAEQSAPGQVPPAAPAASAQGAAAAQSMPPDFQNHWSLFRPQPLFDVLLGVFRPLRHLVVLLPIAFAFGLAAFVTSWPLLSSDLRQISLQTNLLEHLLFTLFTTSLVTQLSRGVVARRFGLHTPSFGISMILGVLPRFNTRILISDDAGRSARLWVSATPVLVRLALFPIGLVLWLTTRGEGSVLPLFGLALALAAMMSLLFIANPLMNNAGYQWLSVYTNNPGLRERAFRALRYSIWKPPEVVSRYTKDSYQLRFYALASVLFMVGLVTFVTLTLAAWLELHYQGLGVVVAVGVSIYVFLHLRRRLVTRTAKRKRRLRNGAEPTPPAGSQARPGPGGDVRAGTAARPPFTQRLGRWIRRGLLLVLLALALTPYRLETGGPARIAPATAQAIYAQYPGVVEEVFFDGGEWVKAGSLLAQMSDIKQRRDLDVARAQLKKTEAQIAVLRSTPTEAEVKLAEQTLETARIRLKFSEESYQRISKLHRQKAVSTISFDDAREALETARQTVREKQAALTAIRQQINPNEIEAMVAEQKRLEREIDYYREILQRTRLVMPFDGRIVTMDLKNLQNKYLDEGDLFAEVQNDREVKVEIDVPEADMDLVNLGDRIRIKLMAEPGRPLVCTIASIHPRSTETDYGEVVTVVGELDNRSGRLLIGMTGQAKIDGRKMLAIRAFTRSLIRFFQIEVWSWLP